MTKIHTLGLITMGGLFCLSLSLSIAPAKAAGPLSGLDNESNIAVMNYRIDEMRDKKKRKKEMGNQNDVSSNTNCDGINIGNDDTSSPLNNLQKKKTIIITGPVINMGSNC